MLLVFYMTTEWLTLFAWNDGKRASNRMRKFEVEQNEMQTRRQPNDNDSISILFTMRKDESDLSCFDFQHSRLPACARFLVELCVFRFLFVIRSFYENVHGSRIYTYTTTCSKLFTSFFSPHDSISSSFQHSSLQLFYDVRLFFALSTEFIWFRFHHFHEMVTLVAEWINDHRSKKKNNLFRTSSHHPMNRI